MLAAAAVMLAAPLAAQEHAAVPRPAIAVLPFATVAGDPQQAFMGQAVAEEILSALAQVRGLSVAPRRLSFGDNAQAADLRGLAADLQVRFVLDGYLRRSPGRVRLTVQLIDTADGSHLWVDTYDRPPQDLFDVENAIVARIARSVGGDVPAPAGLRSPTRNMEAYELTALGRTFHRHAEPAAMIEARELLERAVAIDPGYAPAQAWLALTYAALLAPGPSDAPMAPFMLEAASRAVAGEPASALAHASRAVALAAADRPEAAAAEAKIAAVLGAGDRDIADLLAACFGGL